MNHGNFTDGPWASCYFFHLKICCVDTLLSTLHRKQRNWQKLARDTEHHVTTPVCWRISLFQPGFFKVRLCLESGSHLQTATGRTWGVSRVAFNFYLWYFVVLIASCGLHGRLKMNDTRYIYNIGSLRFLNHVLIEYACGVTPSDRYDFGIFRLRKGNLSPQLVHPHHRLVFFAYSQLIQDTSRCCLACFFSHLSFTTGMPGSNQIHFSTVPASATKSCQTKKTNVPKLC